MDNAQIEMKLHKLADRISKVEGSLDRALQLIEEMKKPRETDPVDRNYHGFK